MADMSWTRPQTDAEWPQSIDLQTGSPHPARVYDYLLGGCFRSAHTSSVG
jgi:hypothetical protein